MVVVVAVVVVATGQTLQCRRVEAGLERPSAGVATQHRIASVVGADAQNGPSVAFELLLQRGPRLPVGEGHGAAVVGRGGGDTAPEKGDGQGGSNDHVDTPPDG